MGEAGIVDVDLSPLGGGLPAGNYVSLTSHLLAVSTDRASGGTARTTDSAGLLKS